jgi:hypothetical protein
MHRLEPTCILGTIDNLRQTAGSASKPHRTYALIPQLMLLGVVSLTLIAFEDTVAGLCGKRQLLYVAHVSVVREGLLQHDSCPTAPEPYLSLG